MEMKIVLKKQDYSRMVAHARACLPDEACGLLAGTVEDDKKLVQKVYLLENADHSPEHFSILPEEQLAAVRDMRANGLVPLGNFHSHPSSPARPSAEDIRLAYDGRASYLILSLAQKEPVLRAFSIAEENVCEQEILFHEDLH